MLVIPCIINDGNDNNIYNKVSNTHIPLMNFNRRVINDGGRKWGFLTTHSTYFILRLHGVGHMVKDYSDSERGNPLPPHGLFFPINSKGSFICTIPYPG